MKEGKEQVSRTTKDNSDHIIPSSLEDDSSVYKTVMVGDNSLTMRNIMNGSRLAISINMYNFNIYIGSDHLSMQINAGISANHLCGGFARFDQKSRSIIVEDFADWRKGTNNEYGIKRAIASAIQRDLIK